MADNATVISTVNILEDTNKAGISGSYDYTLVSGDGDKWVFKKLTVTNASELVLTTSDTYHGVSTAIHGNDLINWLMIYHTSTTDGSTSTSEGIVLANDGDNAAYDDANMLAFIDAGDTYVCKLPKLVTSNLYCRSVAVSNGKPSNNGSGNVQVIVAGILDDV